MIYCGLLRLKKAAVRFLSYTKHKAYRFYIWAVPRCIYADQVNKKRMIAFGDWLKIKGRKAWDLTKRGSKNAYDYFCRFCRSASKGAKKAAIGLAHGSVFTAKMLYGFIFEFGRMLKTLFSVFFVEIKDSSRLFTAFTVKHAKIAFYYISAFLTILSRALVIAARSIYSYAVILATALLSFIKLAAGYVALIAVSVFGFIRNSINSAAEKSREAREAKKAMPVPVAVKEESDSEQPVIAEVVEPERSDEFAAVETEEDAEKPVVSIEAESEEAAAEPVTIDVSEPDETPSFVTPEFEAAEAEKKTRKKLKKLTVRNPVSKPDIGPLRTNPTIASVVCWIVYTIIGAGFITVAESSLLEADLALGFLEKNVSRGTGCMLMLAGVFFAMISITNLMSFIAKKLLRREFSTSVFSSLTKVVCLAFAMALCFVGRDEMGSLPETFMSEPVAAVVSYGLLGVSLVLFVFAAIKSMVFMNSVFEKE